MVLNKCNSFLHNPVHTTAASQIGQCFSINKRLPSPDWHSVYEDFSDLPKAEQHRLFQAIQDTLFPEPKEDIANMVGDIREVRFSSAVCFSVCFQGVPKQAQAVWDESEYEQVWELL
ncbi:hypothetical protein [Paenibacillus sp.]|uniref:hypothetical protein n=1 Tax=Paenibacillus sp. TaxID=58172 RepID=UPI0037C60062